MKGFLVSGLVMPCYLTPKTAKILGFFCENEIEDHFKEKTNVGDHCEWFESKLKGKEERERKS